MEEIYQMKKSRPLKRVIIIGGGKLGFQVAWKLENQFRNLDIRLIDHNREKCERLAGELKRTLVLCGDGADENLLRQEGIEEADGLVCATESDETNLLFAVIGKALGARKTIAVARRKIYMKLDNYMSVDSIVNPNSALASVILRYARYPSGSGVLSIIEKIDAEMLEVTIPDRSPAVGRTIMSLGLPKGILIALIVRRGDAFVPVGATVIQKGDKVTSLPPPTYVRGDGFSWSELTVHLPVIFKVLSLLSAIVSLSMVLPLGWSLWDGSSDGKAFLLSISAGLIFSAVLFMAGKNADYNDIGVKDGFLVVSLSWIFASIIGALPFYISGTIPTFAGAFFESVSGFTTTGASVLSYIEAVPRGILFWRSLTTGSGVWG